MDSPRDGGAPDESTREKTFGDALREAMLLSEERKRIDGQARELASRYKLDVKRVRRLLERLSYILVFGGTLSRSIEETQRSGVLLHDHVETALEILPGEDALALFESEDLGGLAEHVTCTQYLGAMGDNLRTLNELEGLIASFLSYLERNREHMVRTGFPETSFERSQWFETALAKLYYTKLPARADKLRSAPLAGDIDRTESSDNQSTLGCTYVYNWITGVATGRPRECTYEEADLLTGLDAADADRVAGMRGELFELKVDILRVLLQCLQSRDASTLRAECVRLIGEALSGRGWEFCLGMDHFYRPYAPASDGEALAVIPGLLPGGLSSLLEVVWYVEQELTLGTWWQVREALGPLVRPAPTGHPQLAVDHYFRVVSTPDRTRLDRAIDRLQQLQPEATKEREVYYQDMNEALDKIYGGLTTRLEDRPEYARIIDARTHDFGEFYKEQLKEAVSQIVRQPAGPVPALLPAHNVFCKKGQEWHVAYGGIQTTIKDTLGMHHIHQLLRNPGVEIPSIELETLLPGRDASIAQMSEEQSKQEGLDGAERPIETMEFKDVRKLEDERDELLRAAETARDAGEYAEAMVAEENAQGIAKYLVRMTDGEGRPRRAGDPVENARKRVHSRLQTVYSNLAKGGHTDLVKHLRKTIKRGRTFCYDPEQLLDWLTQ